MIVSHTHKFIFWKPMKVGGSSVLYGLGDHCDIKKDIIGCPETQTDQNKKRERLTRLRQFLGTHSRELNHVRPGVIKRLVGPGAWKEYLKVTITRNPWDCVVSMYFWTIHGRGPRSFSNFIRHSGGAFNRAYYFGPQNEVRFDVALEYSRLQEDYNKLCHQVGIEFHELPRLKTHQRAQAQGGKKKHYSLMYNDEDRDFIAEQWSKEIELFGYEFEDKR